LPTNNKGALAAAERQGGAHRRRVVVSHSWQTMKSSRRKGERKRID